jgi:hypothetical protein
VSGNRTHASRDPGISDELGDQFSTSTSDILQRRVRTSSVSIEDAATQIAHALP